MNALTWVSTLRRYLRRFQTRPNVRRRTPRVETLEGLTLLSGHGFGAGSWVSQVAEQRPLIAQRHAVVSPFHAQPSAITSLAAASPVRASAAQTITQTLSVPATLTNFDNLPLLQRPSNQPLSLFDPALGTLTSVQVSSQASFTSSIQSQNTSRSSGATITGNLQGAFVLNGLNQTLSGTPSATTTPVTVAPFQAPFVVTFQPPSGVTFPPLVANNTQTQVLTQPSDLAFYTASPGRTQLTPTLSANATAGASAPNGNLITQVTTTATGTVTVTYTFTPAIPVPPNVVKVIHVGVHHQPTQVIITFDSPLDPIAAQNPQNYTILARGLDGRFTQPVPISSAVYDLAANTVTLSPVRHLNAFQQYELIVNIPQISIGKNGSVFVTPFGGRADLGPVVDHFGNVFLIPPTGPLRFIKR
jgi:hypothetical protein